MNAANIDAYPISLPGCRGWIAYCFVARSPLRVEADEGARPGIKKLRPPKDMRHEVRAD